MKSPVFWFLRNRCEFPRIKTSDDDLREALEDVVSENSVITGDHRHFIPKKPWRKYNVVSMNGDSPY